MFFVEAVGSAKEATGGERPAVVVIAAIDEGLFGQVFVSGVVIDNWDGTFASEIVVVFCDVVFCICDIDHWLALVVGVNLLIVVDDLTTFLSVACNIGDGNRQFNLQVKFNGS